MQFIHSLIQKISRDKKLIGSLSRHITAKEKRKGEKVLSKKQIYKFASQLAGDVHVGKLQPENEKAYVGLFATIRRQIMDSELTEDARAELLGYLRHLLRLFRRTKSFTSAHQSTDETSGYDAIISHIKLVADLLLDESNARSQLPQLDIVTETTNLNWANLAEELSIPDLSGLDKSSYPVYFMGGTARVLARKVFGYSIPTGELPLHDFDFVVSGNQSANDLLKTFKDFTVDPKGLKVLHGLKNEKINEHFCDLDCSFNQVLVGVDANGENRIHYTKVAKESLQSGINKPISETRETFYKTNYYQLPQAPDVRVYSTAMVERLFKFVAERKAVGMTMEKHNFALPLGPSLLNTVRRFISTDIEQQPLLFWRLARILEQTHNIKILNFFVDLDYVINERHPNYHFKKVSSDQTEKAKWFLSLLIRLAIRMNSDSSDRIRQFYPTVPDKKSRERCTFQVPYDEKPDDVFINQFKQWRQNSRFPEI